MCPHVCVKLSLRLLPRVPEPRAVCVRAGTRHGDRDGLHCDRSRADQVSRRQLQHRSVPSWSLCLPPCVSESQAVCVRAGARRRDRDGVHCDRVAEIETECTVIERRRPSLSAATPTSPCEQCGGGWSVCVCVSVSSCLCVCPRVSLNRKWCVQE